MHELATVSRWLDGLSFAAKAIIAAAALLSAVEFLRRRALLPVWRRYQAVLDLIERELRHNGGSSLKDSAAVTVQQIRRVNEQLNDVRSSVHAARREIAADRHATGVVLDTLNEQANAEHAAIWSALAEHGMDRRQSRKQGDPE